MFYISGVLAGQFFKDNISVVLFFVTALLLCAALYIIYKWDKVFLFVLAAFTGFLSVSVRSLPEKTIIEKYALYGETAEVDARVKERQANGSFIAEALDGGVKVLVYPSEEIELKQGYTVRLTGSIRLMSEQRNPGGFNEKMYYAARGLKYKMYAKNITVLSGDINFYARIREFRDALSGVYDKCLPEKEAGIIKSIITGDRSGLLDEVKNLYSVAGIYHVLAISGLHLSIIGLFLNTLLGKLFSKRASGCVTLAFLIFYCVMTGASPSTVRAVTICGIIILGRIIFRKTDPLTSLSFACLCILVYNPFFLWDLGFQLSFSAMAGILLLNEPLNVFFMLISVKLPLMKKFFENFWVRQSLNASIAAFLATALVGTGYLTNISLYTVPVNIIVFPTFFILVAAGFLTGCVGLVSITAGSVFAGILYYLLNLYEAVLNFFTSLPLSSFLTGYIPLYITIPYYIFIGLCSYYLLKLPNRSRVKRFVPVSAAILVVAICAHIFMPRPLEVTMLDVSQGDSFVISKNKFTAVIDGGGWANVDEGKNTGVKILVPYLNYLGKSEVDFAVITHLDYDHAAGISELLSLKNVKTLCIPATVDKNDQAYIKIAEAAAKYGTELKLLKKGDVYSNKDIIFYCLHPGENTNFSGTNDNSVVLKLIFKENSFLFAGDITGQAEKVLAKDFNINAQVLKLAHHGSKYSNTEEFLDAVSPGLAIVSYSKYNNYGLLPDEVLQRLLERNIPLLQTAEHGAVTLVSDGKKLRVKRSVK